MTNPLNIPYMVENGHLKVKDGYLTLIACLPHSPQSGLKFGWRNIKSMSVYLASYILQIYLKKKWKKVRKQCLLWAQVSNFTFLLRLAITPYCP